MTTDKHLAALRDALEALEELHEVVLNEFGHMGEIDARVTERIANLRRAIKAYEEQTPIGYVFGAPIYTRETT